MSARILVSVHQGAAVPSYVLAACGALLLAACTPHRTPPPTRLFEGLPVSGTLADARAAGFTNCTSDEVSMRCLRTDVRLEGQGPYEASVDLVGSDGNGGFDQVILWSDRDQFAVLAVGEALKNGGWRLCMTGDHDRGDQEIYTRSGTPIRVSIDISYWNKRRLRLQPIREAGKPTC